MKSRKLTRHSESTTAGRIARREEKPELLETQRAELLSMPLDSLAFEQSLACYALVINYVLENHGVRTVGDLANCTESELLALPRFGKKCLAGVKTELAGLGLSLRGDEKPALLEEQRREEIRSRPVSSLKLEGLDQYAARRAKGSLERRGVATLGDVQCMSERDLHLTKSVGEKAIIIIKAEMAALGVPIGESMKAGAPEPGTVEFERLVSMPIEDLKLPGLNPGRANMARRIWKEGGIVSIGDAICRSPSELRLKDGVRSYGTGRGTVKALTRGLSEHGLRLGMAREMEEHRLVRNLAKGIEGLIPAHPAGLRIRVRNCLENAEMHRIYDVVQRTEAHFLKTKNFGRKSVGAISDALGKMGLSLGMELDEGTIGKAKLLAGGASAVRLQDKAVSDKPFIGLNDSGQLETNLSRGQLGALIRLAKKELRELREDLQPHRIKVIGEFLDLFEGGKKA